MIKKSILALAALSAGVSAQAQNASALSVTADISYVTDYVFRAVRASTDSIQPSVEATYGDIYAGVWNSNDLNSDGVSETDLYAGYNLKVSDSLSLDVGVTRFLYEGQSTNDTTEVFVGTSFKGVVTPSIYYYYDLDREVNTFEASLGYSLPIDAIKASLDLTGKLGYVNRQGDLKGYVDGNTGEIDTTTENDYTYFSAGAAIPYKLSDTATLTVGVEYVYNNEKTLSQFDSGKNETDIIVGKAGISIGF
jgi:uncharacterized protein (TIGR02001 family)